jgi:predicted nuclease of predicted toxin-antitoxin system
MIQVKVADKLRESGYDVLRCIDTGQERADDKKVLKKAIDQKRILITLDSQFGDWAVLPLSKHSGVIRLRVHPTTGSNIINVLLPFLKKISEEEVKNKLIILSATKEKWIATS